MIWEEVRKAHENQWLIIEAIDAHQSGDKKMIDQMAVVNTFYNDNNKALLEYVKLHKKHRERQLYVVHTSVPKLEIYTQRWIGVRAD
jgi:hypothetical protein